LQVTDFVRLSVLLLIGSLLPATVAAQQPADAGPAARAGLHVSPKWGQSKEQQLQSEEECYARARAQTGVDPAAMPPAADSAAAAPDSAPKGATAGIITGRWNARSDRIRAGQLADFRKIMTACLEAGGYTVP
jgi:hypothetical protein